MTKINPNGFTLIEMLFVMLLGAVVLGVGTRAYSQVENRRAVDNASDAAVLTAFRARSEAMRAGTPVYLKALPGSDVIRVEDPTGAVLHTLDMQVYAVDLIGSDLSLCYTARGFALPGCTSFDDPQTLRFVRGVDTTTVTVMPLGQVRRQE